MLEKVGEKNLNECHLWHGTTFSAAKSISVQGFDHRVGVKNARVWGNGVYFTSDADFALSYSSGARGAGTSSGLFSGTSALLLGLQINRFLLAVCLYSHFICEVMSLFVRLLRER